MHTIYGRRRQAARFSASFRSLDRGLGRVFDTILSWSERSRQRRALMTLDDRMLRDIGLTRGQVEVEGGKPFWER